jgi:hypothetical protein
MAVPIPPLNISAGPSGADGQATGSANGSTGDFFFGRRESGWQETLQGAVPLIIVGGLFLWAIRR